jgi:hypothetical protein
MTFREDDMALIPMSVAVTCAILVVSSAMLASPEQTRTPGQMTEAHVWVENRGANEALPVDLRDVNLDHPLRVQVVNSESQYGSSNPVQVRPVRQPWDYRTILVLPAEDLVAKLNTLGAEGWETTGITFVKVEGTMVLLKRPR